MRRNISNKDIRACMKTKLVFVKVSQVRIVKTTKALTKVVILFVLKQLFIG